MKLLSAHIENFGKISDRTFDFKEGLNVICGENGWGKTTLCAFLKVMFFGFENERTRDAYENERKRFKPWQGGVYGGSVNFEADGVEYRLLRTFGLKEAEDEFVLKEVATGLDSNAFGKNIGEELFAIDAESFKRTVFFSQKDCITGPTDSINAKIGNLNDVSDDMNKYEEVMKLFKDELNKMSPTRATGSMSKIKDEIAGTEKKLLSKAAVEANLAKELATEEEYKRERERILKEREEVNALQAYISEESVNDVERKAYRQLCVKEEERKKELEQTKAVFPKEIPTAEEMEKQFQEAGSLQSKKESVRIYKFTEEEEAEEKEAKKMFFNRSFEELKHRDACEKVEKFYSARSRYEKVLLRAEELEKLETYTGLFENEFFSMNAIEGLEKNWQEIEQRRSSLLAKKEAHAILEAEEKSAQPKPKNYAYVYILYILGLIACVAAAVVMYFVFHLTGKLLLIPAIVFGVLLIAFIIACISIKRKKSEKSIFLQSEEMKTRIVEEENTLASMEYNVRRQLTDRGFLEEEEKIEHGFWKIKTQFEEYNDLLKRKEQLKHDKTPEEMILHAEGLETYIKSFHESATDWEKLEAAIRNLQEQKEDDIAVVDQQRIIWNTSLSAIREAEKKRATFMKKRAEYSKSVENLEDTKTGVRHFLQSIGVEPKEDMFEQISSLRDSLKAYEEAKQEYEAAVKEREEYAKNADIEPEKEEDKPAGWKPGMTLEDCKEKIASCDRRLDMLTDNASALRTRILVAQEQLDDLMSEQDRLNVLQDLLKEQKSKYRLLEYTRDYMEKSKTAFTSKYMGPVSTAFGKYMEMIMPDSKIEYAFDANTNLTIQECGLPRETAAFSTGMQDLFGICFRMSLIEAMYQEEKPMVVLDDPFVNLDDDKTKGALEFLEEVAKEYQVIYFTCRKDRTGEEKK